MSVCKNNAGVVLHVEHWEFNDRSFFSFSFLSRRQFGPKGQEEVKIIDHQTQHLRLMPHLATALALTFTSRYCTVSIDKAKICRYK